MIFAQWMKENGQHQENEREKKNTQCKKKDMRAFKADMSVDRTHV